MKFMTKKSRLLPLSVALITTLSFATSAFAATYVTTTTYNFVDNTVNVSSTVSGVATNEEITYLVNKVPYDSPSDIIYIDQKNSASSNDVNFSFTTAQMNIGLDTSIKFGAATTTPLSPVLSGKDNVLLLPARVLTHSDTVISSIYSHEASNYMISFGTITNWTVNDEYGLLFSKNPSAITNISTYAQVSALNSASGTVKKYPSLGKNANNQFAIKLVNGFGDNLTAGTYYTRTYTLCDYDVVVLGEVKTVTLSE